MSPKSELAERPPRETGPAKRPSQSVARVIKETSDRLAKAMAETMQSELRGLPETTLQYVDTGALFEKAKALVQDALKQAQDAAEPETPPVTSTRHPRLAQLAQAALPARQRLVDERYIVPAEELAAALGLKPPALYRAVAENRLFVLEIGPKKYYPAFYSNPAFRRQDLERVSRVLSNLSGWNKWQFFMRRNASLGDLSPLEALEQGRLQDVVDAAHAYIGR